MKNEISIKYKLNKSSPDNFTHELEYLQIQSNIFNPIKIYGNKPMRYLSYADLEFLIYIEFFGKDIKAPIVYNKYSINDKIIRNNEDCYSCIIKLCNDKVVTIDVPNDSIIAVQNISDHYPIYLIYDKNDCGKLYKINMNMNMYKLSSIIYITDNNMIITKEVLDFGSNILVNKISILDVNNNNYKEFNRPSNIIDFISPKPLNLPYLQNFVKHDEYSFAKNFKLEPGLKIPVVFDPLFPELSCIGSLEDNNRVLEIIDIKASPDDSNYYIDLKVYNND